MLKQRLTSSIRASLFALAALSLLISPAFSQVLGTLTGSVTDPSDASVPAAAVTVKDLASGQTFKVTTDERGIFSVGNLNNGFFDVLVEKPGFATVRVPKVQVFVSQTSRINAKMEIAQFFKDDEIVG